MVQFSGDDLKGSRFHDVDLNDAEFSVTYLTRAVFKGVDLSGVVMRGVDLIDVQIDGEIEKVVINGVDVVPLVDAELDRRDPGRAKMRPTEPDGFREAWDLVEQRWSETVDRARRLDPEMLHRSVNGEWSFTETLRHLIFATNSWVRRGMLGDPAPWSPLDLPWDEMSDIPGIPRDREIRPSLDEVLVVRGDRMSGVRSIVNNLTQGYLDSHTEPVEGPGWPPPESIPVRKCLLVVLHEEWQHRHFAERDLDVLEGENSA